jgi:hypothetical protein
MGKLTRSAGRVLGAGALVLAGAGVLVLAGAGIANAQPARTSSSTSTSAGASACDEYFAEFNSLGAMLKKHPGAWGPVAAAATAFAQVASTAPPTVKSDIGTFVSDLRADVAARRVLSRPKLVADADAIIAACAAQATSPSGAPATGGGSTAGVQDPALFGAGGAAVLAGIGVLILARRNRPRGNPGRG